MPRSLTGESASTQTGNSRRTRSKRGLTCANCRLRKTRCDGSLPGCKTCEVYGVECRYERPPPMTQIVAMAERIQECERTMVELRAALEKATGSRGQNHDQSLQVHEESSQITDLPSVEAGFEDVLHTETDASPHASTSQDSEPEQRLLSDLSLDENGKLCYYGPTSAVHAPLQESPRTDDACSVSGQASVQEARTLLSSSALDSRSWEEFALGNASMQTDIPRQVISRLLQIHWTWISPMFNWVYRPAFMRDMAIGGPCYSPFLLTVMCSHAARFDSAKTSEMLISKARLLLGTEIHRPSSIPTAQALLQLSARDLAYGSISQAWLYSGMAFRMVSDLGLHHSTAKIATLGNLSTEDLEIRRRLFWSSYFWDKAISLYLGRMPVLLELPLNRSPEFLDDSAEDEIWSPHCVDSMNLSKVAVGEYPQSKSHAVSSFENSCKLAVILNDIILHLYSRRETNTADDKLRVIRNSLDEWRQKSPAHLKYDPDHLPEICPPPHILTQNLLYFTAVILLHRPFYTIPAHHATCRAASDNIQKLILLLEKTFGFARITYLMAYCVYTGASVMMQDVKKGDLDASVKMQTFLQCLQQGTATCPVVQRSIDIITNGLRSDETTIQASRPDTAATDRALFASNYLPAFPWNNPSFDFSGDANQGGMNVDGFAMLDSFPEAQYDSFGSEGTWFFTPQ